MNPGAAKPEQYPAPRPVRGPKPKGPVLSPNGMASSSFLSSRHGGAAFRALHLIARLARNMRYFLAATRAHALAPRPAGQGTPHPSATAASETTAGSPATTTAASAAETHSRTSWHCLSPLAQPTGPSAAAGHAKRLPGQPAVQKGCQDVLDRPANKPEHSNAGGNQRGLQRRRNRTTDQNIRIQLQKLAGAGRRIRPAQAPFLSPHLPAVLDIDEQHIRSHVEYRGNASLMLGNGQPHTFGGALLVPDHQALRKREFAHRGRRNLMQDARLGERQICRLQWRS